MAGKTQPIQVVVDDELRARILRIHEREDIPQAVVIRDILEAGIDERERVSLERYPEG